MRYRVMLTQNGGCVQFGIPKETMEAAECAARMGEREFPGATAWVEEMKG